MCQKWHPHELRSSANGGLFVLRLGQHRDQLQHVSDGEGKHTLQRIEVAVDESVYLVGICEFIEHDVPTSVEAATPGSACARARACVCVYVYVYVYA
jgi:hypothetical protein